MYSSMRSLLFALVITYIAAGAAQATVFTQTDFFPQADAGAFGIQIRALASGQLVVWNGYDVYLQTLAGGEAFSAIATGYAGDPAFLAVAPDGHTLLLGAGYSGKLYLLDIYEPIDYEAGSEIATVTHYAGVFITQNLVLLDRGEWPMAELGILDVSAGTYRKVMDKPAVGDVDTGAGEFAASANLAVCASGTTVYAMSVVYDASYIVVLNELKSIGAADLLDAYASKALLDWNVDATAIGASGAFNDGGASAVTVDGDLLLGGFGSVQAVVPVSATVTNTYDPAGFTYYGVAYDPFTDSPLPIVADVDWSMDVVYAPQSAFAELPAAGTAGLLMLASLSALLGVLNSRRQ